MQHERPKTNFKILWTFLQGRFLGLRRERSLPKIQRHLLKAKSRTLAKPSDGLFLTPLNLSDAHAKPYPQRCTRRRVADGTPSRSFWYVAVFPNDFNFSGKPLIFLTRWGIFYGRWRCWRPVASPTMMPSWPPSWILSRIKNHVKIVKNSSFGGLCMENNTWISKLHYLYYMYFHPKMAWPPAIYDVISRNHSNWPSISLSLLSCVASIY